MGLYPDGRPGELFITMAKEGSTIGGLMDCFGTAVSMSLQYGVPLEVYVNKFSHTRFEPMGFTKNPDIKIAKSLVDYIFRWLGITFLPGFREANKMAAARRRSIRRIPTSRETTETELRPAATTAGGPNAAQGSAKTATRSNGIGANGGNGHGGPKHAAKRNGSSRPCAGADGPASPWPCWHAAAAQARPSRFAIASEQFASFQTDAPTCDNCGAITVRNGNCYLCYNCGSSMGCS